LGVKRAALFISVFLIIFLCRSVYLYDLSFEKASAINELDEISVKIEQKILTDEEAYKILVLFPRTKHSNSGLSWKNHVLNIVEVWKLYVRKYPTSPFVSHAYLRMAEWYLHIRIGDDKPLTLDSETKSADPKYRAEALFLLNMALKNFYDYDQLSYHLSDVGEDAFARDDKVGAVALNLRAYHFPAYRCKDLARLKKEFSQYPSAKDALKNVSRKECG